MVWEELKEDLIFTCVEARSTDEIFDQARPCPSAWSGLWHHTGRLPRAAGELTGERTSRRASRTGPRPRPRTSSCWSLPLRTW